MSPLAKRTAAEQGVDLAGVQGTGPNNRVILADVEDAMKAPKKAAAVAATPAPQK